MSNNSVFTQRNSVTMNASDPHFNNMRLAFVKGDASTAQQDKEKDDLLYVESIWGQNLMNSNRQFIDDYNRGLFGQEGYPEGWHLEAA